MERSPIASRLEELIQARGISLKELAELLQVQRSSLSHILSGRNKPSLDFMLKLMQTFPDVNEKWLLHGKGMRDLSPADTDSDEHNITDVTKTDVTGVNKEATENVTTVNSTEPPEYSPISKLKTSTLGKGNKVLKQIILVYSDNSFELLQPEAQE